MALNHKGRNVRIAYLVHDLTDPAVARRVEMLQCGGANVVVAGFHRSETPPAMVAGVEAIALGRTQDARMVSRAGSVLRARASVGTLVRKLGPVDAIMARNLEMLAIASVLRRSIGVPLPLTYEVLDVHRLAIDAGIKGRVLRALEGRLARDAHLLVTSSPAFLEGYFKPLSRVRLPVRIVENKVLAGSLPPAAEQRRAGPPWRIGVFGALRCRRSLEILRDLAAARNGRVEVVIRGRPSTAVFPDLAKEVAAWPHCEFHGPYRNPQDLPDIYSDIHFVWAIDYYEAGGNSEWLLPNRLYEGGLYGAVPLARDGTEIAVTLRRLDTGVVLTDDVPEGARRVLHPSRRTRLAARGRAGGAGAAAQLRRHRRRVCGARGRHRGRTASGSFGGRMNAPLTAHETLVVIPTLNEADHIGALLEGLLREADAVPLRIVVADGGSVDATRRIVGDIAAADPRVVLMHNPERIQSAGVNAAVRAFGAMATQFIRLDAHSVYPPDYCQRLIAEAAETRADSVVVSMATVGRSCFQRGVAAAQNSRLGVGGSAHRIGSGGREIDHGHHALMRVDAFRAVGGYDEAFTHNEDAELDHRLGLDGRRIWLTGAVAPIYYPRDTAGGLFRQYRNYGRGRARTIAKHRMRPKPRQLAPAMIVPAIAGGVAGLAVAPFLGSWTALAALPALLWMGICLVGGALLGAKRREVCAFWSGPAAMIMHAAWSAGFIEGLLRYWRRQP